MEQLPDLERPCPQCEGSGEVNIADPAEFKAWDDKLAEIEARDPMRVSAELQAHYRALPPDFVPCGECDGTGKILTDAGHQIARFVRRRVLS